MNDEAVVWVLIEGNFLLLRQSFGRFENVLRIILGKILVFGLEAEQITSVSCQFSADKASSL